MLNPFTNFDVHILINLTPYVKEQLIPNNVFVPFKFEIVFPKHLRNSQLIHIKHFTVNSPHKYFNNTLDKKFGCSDYKHSMYLEILIWFEYWLEAWFMQKKQITS